MQWRNSTNNYGALAKLLHWTIVILIIAQYVIIEAAEELPDGVEKLSQISLHKSVGMLVLLLAVAGLARGSGGLVGAAAMAKMSPALYLVGWLSRRQWRPVVTAGGTAIGLSLLALPNPMGALHDMSGNGA